MLRRYWHAVAADDELNDRPLARTLLGEQIVIWRAPIGPVSAAFDRCPHREAPLSEGWIQNDCLVCPYHGWAFAHDGRCVDVPSSGRDATIPSRARLATVHCRSRYGLVWVCLDEPAADIPSMPWEDDPSFRRLNNPVEIWHAATTRMVDNFLDFAHFPFVHVQSFGGASEREVPTLDLADLPDGYHGFAYSVVAANDASGAEGASGQSSATVERRMTTGFALPFAVRSTIAYSTGLQHNLLLLSAPIDDEHSWFTFVVWRNDDFSVPADEVVQLDRLIGAEDKTMLEKIRGTLPLDATTLLSVQSDRASVEWKRRLRALLTNSEESPSAP
jgi:phenylpropionate dioxygenase-like ring-hydroxylating dioxygenase large terminal subunit